jgi:pyrophosphate--fructose-6-phosphate 1-phosphotransferase
MLTMERRKGKDKAVIRKTLVDLDGPAFRLFEGARNTWAVTDDYRFAGPIQYFGPAGLVDRVPVSLTVQ